MSAKILNKLPLIALALIFTLTIGSAAATPNFDTCTSDQDNNPCDLSQNTCDGNCNGDDGCTEEPTDPNTPTDPNNPTDTDNSNNVDNSAAGAKDPSIVNTSAATNTIPLKKTGVPAAPIALAVISIFAGLIAPKIR